jgi:hypothetical protein
MISIKIKISAFLSLWLAMKFVTAFLVLLLVDQGLFLLYSVPLRHFNVDWRMGGNYQNCQNLRMI